MVAVVAGGTAERNNRISEARAAAYDRAALKSQNALAAAATAGAAVTADHPVDDEQISDTDTDDEMQGRPCSCSCSHAASC